MPEPRDDPKKSWTYDLISPGANLQVERSKARLPGLVESVGTDGRSLGAVRTFPGFADTTVHNVPVSGTGRSVTWTLQNITLAKYASIAKGTSGARLRGIVLIADNQAGNKKAAYFAYYDSSTGTTDVKQITEDFTFSSDGNRRTFRILPGIATLGLRQTPQRTGQGGTISAFLGDGGTIPAS